MTVYVKCVHCGERVHEFTTKCPKCGKPVANKYAPTDVPDAPRSWKTDSAGKKLSPMMVIIGVLLAVAIAVAVYMVLNK